MREAHGRGWCVARQPAATWWRVLAHALCGTLTPLVLMEATWANTTTAAGASVDADAGGGGGAAGAAARAGALDARAELAARVGRALDFYRAPYTKFVLRMVCYSIFLILYALVLMQDDGTPDFSLVELAFFGWAGGHALDELHQVRGGDAHTRSRARGATWGAPSTARARSRSPSARAATTQHKSPRPSATPAARPSAPPAARPSPPGSPSARAPAAARALISGDGSMAAAAGAF